LKQFFVWRHLFFKSYIAVMNFRNFADVQ